MPRVGFASEIDVGGRSPKTGNCLEQIRASRRLGLTHSLDSPRAPESEPAKSDPPGRESPTGELPRPRSASPTRNLAPPSVRGSALSAKIQRATTMRAKSPLPVQPPPPTPPRTRARFSVKLCEGSEGGTDAQPAAEQDSKVTTTSPKFTVGTDTTPLVVLPLAVAAEAASTETPPQEKETTGTRDQGRAVGGHGDEAGKGIEPRSPGSVIGIAASVFGIEGSQIQRSQSPPVPARHATHLNTTIEKQRSSSSPARSDASWISPSSSSSPPRSPPSMSPGGMPAGFSAASIRRSRLGAFGKIAPSPAGTDDEGAQRQPKHLSSWSARKPLPLLHTSASILPIPPPETPPTDGVLRPTQVPPPPILKPSMTGDASSSSLEGSISLFSFRPPPADATSSSSSSSPPPPRRAERSENASPIRTPQSSPRESNHRDQQQEQERQRQQQQQQPLRPWSSMFGVGGKGKGDGGVNSAVGGEQSMESDLDFIRELTQYRSTALRRARQNEYEFALVLKPNDEYRDAVEVLELALDLRDGAAEGKAKTTSPQKLDNARRIRESLDGFGKPSSRDLGVSESSQGISGSQNGGIGARKAASPPQVRPGLSEGLEGGGGGSRRQRLSLLDDLQEEEGVLTNRRRKELERKKKHRLVLFVDNMREGVIVRRHLAHHTCEQIVLQSTDDCRTITWKPLLAVNGGASNGGGGILGKLRKRGRVSRRAESIMAEHIAHVLPATDPDPSHPGFFGTRALRLSEDIANPARTFSLLYGDWGGARGVDRAEHLQTATGGRNGTLDVECDDDRTYALLFQGFLLLHMQTTPAAVPGMTPHVPSSSTPSKPSNGKTAPIPGLDNMEAGSGTKGFPRSWSVRKLTSSRSSSALARIPSDRNKRSSEVAGEEASPPLGVAGARGSLRKSLKFLPELLGGLSTSTVLSRRGSQQQQTASNIMGSAPPEFFLGWTSPGTQIWSRLRLAGLEVEKLYSLDRRRVLLKIRLPTSKLEEVAETMRLKLRRRDGTIGRFKKDHRSLFSQSADGDLFRSGESQKVIDHLVRAKIKDGGSELDNRTELGKHISKRMPLHNQARLEALYNAWVVYWRVPPTPTLQQNHQQQQRVKAAVKVESSEEEEDEYLTRSERMREKAEEAREALVATARLSLVVLRGSMWQPLEMIADYFGEATAFYFAWMGFYTQGLIVPSIFGVIVFACQVHAGTLDHPMMTVYAVFVILWSSAFLVLWRHRCSELAYRWGVLNFEQEEQTRSQFWGKEQLDHVTGRFGREYPVWKRWATYAVTMPIMVGFTAAVLLLMFTVIVKRDSASGVDRGMEDPEFWGIMLVKPMLYGIAIPILYGLCKKLGVFLNDLENHKTENKYRNALIVKVFSFRFVTVFASLYHYAFISREGSSNYKLLRLAASLCSFMTIGQWCYMVWMCYIPERVQNWKINKLKAKVEAERRKLEKAEADEAKGAGTGEAGEASRGVRRKLLDEAGDHLWEEALLKEYDLTDVFDDYTMSLIQFGYVALFSAAFPLAPLLAMINNLVQTRVDAHKICKTRRRPIALKSGGIGVWDNVLQLMTLIAVITNCALIGVTSTRWWPDDVSPATQILVVVIVEHVILFLKYWLESTVPRVPTKVQRALLRERMERDQKGTLAKAGSGDRSKFETNFSRALADESSVSYGGGSGYVSKRTNSDTGASYSTPTKVITVDENLTATTPTASGRVRRVFSANLSGSGCSSGSTSRSTSPARSFASCTPPPGTSGASISTPEPDGTDATSAMFQEQMLPPPSASTVRTGSNLYSSSYSTIPPLPPRRFGWDADSTQAS